MLLATDTPELGVVIASTDVEVVSADAGVSVMIAITDIEVVSVDAGETVVRE